MARRRNVTSRTARRPEDVAAPCAEPHRKRTSPRGRRTEKASARPAAAAAKAASPSRTRSRRPRKRSSALRRRADASWTATALNMAAPGLEQVLSRRASVPPPGKGGHRGRPREDRPHRSGRRRGERARRRVVVRSASALADAAATTPETRNMAFTSSSAKTSRGAPSNGHHAEQDLMDDRSSSPEPVFYSSVKSEKATRHSKRTDAAE
ncbi:hypothetical protein ISCGN_025354 [Ixodes scapularis]